MTDDLVARLRNEEHWTIGLCDKAADEIERLRAALHRINGLNDHPARFSPDIDAVIEAALAKEKTDG
jgi:hypothetical protein